MLGLIKLVISYGIKYMPNSIRYADIEEKEILKEATNWMSKKLLGRLDKKCKIYISIKDLGDRYCGLAKPLDGIRPKKFSILLNKDLSLERKLLHLAHELVHVKQFAREELYCSNVNSSKWRWQGKWYDVDDEDDEQYWMAPWEVEAHGKALGLLVLWNRNGTKVPQSLDTFLMNY